MAVEWPNPFIFLTIFFFRLLSLTYLFFISSTMDVFLLVEKKSIWHALNLYIAHMTKKLSSFYTSRFTNIRFIIDRASFLQISSIGLPIFRTLIVKRT